MSLVSRERAHDRAAATTPAQAASLLDEVIYEQVVECIDLDALYRLEHSLTLLVGELDGISDDRVCETAKAMLDRALRRLPDDVWRYLRPGDAPPLDGSALCEENPRPLGWRRCRCRGGSIAGSEPRFDD